MQIRWVGDAKTRVLIYPGMVKGIRREASAMDLDRIEQGPGPNWKAKRRTIPFTKNLKKSIVDLYESLAFEKAGDSLTAQDRPALSRVRPTTSPCIKEARDYRAVTTGYKHLRVLHNAKTAHTTSIRALNRQATNQKLRNGLNLLSTVPRELCD